MSTNVINIISGSILEEEPTLNLAELCQCCQTPAEFIIRLVDQGVIAPLEGESTRQWRFHQSAQIRTHKALRLRQDLGINLSGVALSLELLDEIDNLKKELNQLKHIAQNQLFD
ncbi:chaperone modulator CbpM [uncultured Cocleimonas sp.]|uniref:chaperone modulator CbpM n=1 Tax=uncultured Cocleimonas sp. TaxID=1051587 RepID=UPI002601DF7A|nr:chaperone modulator CbpM [uncultured Cocleimonas sp.]